MKTKRFLKSITAAVVALGLAFAPLTDIPFLRDLGITASAATSGTTTTGLYWEINGSTLTFTGTGAIPDYNSLIDRPWAPNAYYTTSITNIVIGSGVTQIGYHAFDKFSKLTSVTIPDSVTRIRGYAFYGCDQLTSVSMPGVSCIENCAFYNCTALKTVTISNKLSKNSADTNAIQYAAFRSCDALETVYFDGNADDWTTLKSKTDKDDNYNDTLINKTPKYKRTIAFDSGGGSGSMDAGAAYDSQTYTLPANGFTRSGYKFKCWSVGGANKNPGDGITITGDTTVTAVWECDHSKNTNALNGNCAVDVKCSVCNAVIRAAKSHTVVSDAAVAATCTTTGLTEGKHCSVCDTVITAQTTTPVLGHNFDAESTPSAANLKSAATCTSKAVYYKVCTRCGVKGTDTYEYGSPLGHNYAEESTPSAANLKTPATCTDTAVYYKVCTRCSLKGTDTYEYGPANGHSFTSYTSNNDATCTADGTKTATCDNCSVTDTVTDTGSALGHAYSTDWQYDGTNHWHECTRCGDKKDITAHTYDQPDHKCVCGAGETDSAHTSSATDYVIGETTHWKKCDLCDEHVGETAHTYDQLNHKCVCGKSDPSPTHTYAEEATPSDGNRKSAATCVNRAVYYKVCTNCGAQGTETYEYGDLADHNYAEEASPSAANLSIPATCTEKAVYYKVCTVCGDVSAALTYEYGEPNGHNYAEEETPPDGHRKTSANCTDKAVYYKTCTVCGDVSATETYEYGSPLGHDYSAAPSGIGQPIIQARQQHLPARTTGAINIPKTR